MSETDKSIATAFPAGETAAQSPAEGAEGKGSVDKKAAAGHTRKMPQTKKSSAKTASPDKQSREERLAEALRANLRRRKSAAKSRRDPE